METLSWMYHHFILVVNFVFGAIVALVAWVGFHVLFEFIKERQKVAAYVTLIVFLVISPVAASRLKHWGTHADHVAINIPQHYETQEEVDNRWEGFVNGVYYANWVFWVSAILLCCLSFVPSKRADDSDDTGETTSDAAPDAESKMPDDGD